MSTGDSGQRSTGSTSAEGGAVQCQLCPKACVIAPGQSGECRIRVNLDGRLLAVTFGRPVSIHLDPIEKKPLYHFLPGTPILSLATVGCNLHCLNCQNWEISQANPEETPAYRLSPEGLIDQARREGCPSIAYTYTEPLAYYEYTLETSLLARERGLRNVLVTAGYANPEPLRRLFAVTDAANIDIKAMSDDFYRRICGGTLEPVLRACELARELGVWLEVTNLVIPTLNDDRDMIESLCQWIVQHLGPSTPLHFSGFTPRYRLSELPDTPRRTLNMARQIGLDQGLEHVYIGNVRGGEGSHTYCPSCGQMLIERVGFQVRTNDLPSSGDCPSCGHHIDGVWQ